MHQRHSWGWPAVTQGLAYEPREHDTLNLRRHIVTYYDMIRSFIEYHAERRRWKAFPRLMDTAIEAGTIRVRRKRKSPNTQTSSYASFGLHPEDVIEQMIVTQNS